MTQGFYRLNELNFGETEKLFKKVFANYPHFQKILNTYQYVKKAHGKQQRIHLPIPYTIHLLRICLILYKYHRINDLDMFEAALLHDVVEDTKITQTEIEKKFNSRVAEFVKALTRIKPIHETPLEKYHNKAKKFKKILDSSKDIKILKTIDLIDNMNDWLFITKKNPEHKKFPRWLAEAKYYYLPLAKSLGNSYLKPMEYVYKILIKRGYQPNSLNPQL